MTLANLSGAGTPTQLLLSILPELNDNSATHHGPSLSSLPSTFGSCNSPVKGAATVPTLPMGIGEVELLADGHTASEW